MIATVVGQVLLGWLAADFLTGVVHWWEDRVARCDWPLIGRAVIAANRLHHRMPLAFTHNAFLNRNAATWAAVAVISAVWLLLAGPSLILLSATVGGLAANEIHLLTHRPERAGQLLRILQQIGVVQSPPHHAGHHRSSDSRYCVLTSWLNPVLDGARFWFALERLLTIVRLTPNLGTA